MPTYSYICLSCGHEFELFSTIRDYNSSPNCLKCAGDSTARNYDIDMRSICPSVRKSDSELKTIGDLASRNRDRMSEDQKQQLHQKHNDYKDNKIETNPLPKGMSYKKKPPKPIWPGSKKNK